MIEQYIIWSIKMVNHDIDDPNMDGLVILFLGQIEDLTILTLDNGILISMIEEMIFH